MKWRDLFTLHELAGPGKASGRARAQVRFADSWLGQAGLFDDGGHGKGAGVRARAGVAAGALRRGVAGALDRAVPTLRGRHRLWGGGLRVGEKGASAAARVRMPRVRSESGGTVRGVQEVPPPDFRGVGRVDDELFLYALLRLSLHCPTAYHHECSQASSVDENCRSAGQKGVITA